MELTTIVNMILYAVIAWFLFTRFAPVRGLRNVTSQEFSENIKEVNSVLVDVREPHEFKQGHIPGAVNIPLSQLKKRMQEIPNEKSVLLYCRSGMRSKQAGRLLRKAGVTDIAHLRGGMMAWHGNTKK